MTAVIDSDYVMYLCELNRRSHWFFLALRALT